jgi:hypothetical protein
MYYKASAIQPQQVSSNLEPSSVHLPLDSELCRTISEPWVQLAGGFVESTYVTLNRFDLNHEGALGVCDPFQSPLRKSTPRSTPCAR